MKNKRNFGHPLWVKIFFSANQNYFFQYLLHCFILSKIELSRLNLELLESKLEDMSYRNVQTYQNKVKVYISSRGLLKMNYG